MNHLTFRKIFTRFCQLPWLIVPVAILTAIVSGTTWYDLRSTLLFLWIVVVILFVCFCIGAFIKFLYYKERPNPQEYSKRWHKIDASSFPSIHTAYATVLMSIAFTVSNVLHQNKQVLGALVLAVCAIVFYLLIGHSRVVLKKHFFVDVIFGTVLWFIVMLFCLWHMDAILAAAQVFFGL